MKTKLRFLRWLMMLLLSAGVLVAWAQTSQTPTQDVCPGSEPYLVTPHVGSTYLWQITPPGGWSITTPNASSTNVIWPNPAIATTYILSLTETNSNGCDSVVSVAVTVHPQVLPTFTQLGPFCENSVPPALPLTSLEGITGTWNPAVITTTVTGPTTYTFTPDNAAQCGLPTTMVINITPAPVPTINCHADVCEGTAGDVFTTEAGMTSYIWTVSAGGVITSGGTPTDNTVTITWTGTGPQSVSVNYTSTCPGLVPATCTFNVNAVPATSPIFHN